MRSKGTRLVGLLGLMVLIGPALLAQSNTLELEVSATCENAVILINGRVYSGRPVTISVPLGEAVTLQIAYRQLDTLGFQR